MSDPAPTYLILDEVKDTLRYKSRKSVYRLAEDPTCPVLRIGGTLRFPRERFLAWLREHEQGRGRSRPRAPATVRARTFTPTSRRRTPP